MARPNRIQADYDLRSVIKGLFGKTYTMTGSPDFDEFQTLLLYASRKAFTDVQRQHPEESFYAFGLFHEPLWAYIFPTSSSEDGLTQRAEEYQRDPYHLGYAQQSLEKLKCELRWNPGDWSYHRVGKEHFDRANGWLDANNIYWMHDDDERAWDEMNTRLLSICRTVLQELDAEGLFGKGLKREQVILNIVMGDQDHSWLEHARLLNSPSAYERWLTEIRQGGLL